MISLKTFPSKHYCFLYEIKMKKIEGKGGKIRALSCDIKLSKNEVFGFKSFICV
jgi:hypothetical protein